MSRGRTRGGADSGCLCSSCCSEDRNDSVGPEGGDGSAHQDPRGLVMEWMRGVRERRRLESLPGPASDRPAGGTSRVGGLPFGAAPVACSRGLGTEQSRVSTQPSFH